MGGVVVVLLLVLPLALGQTTGWCGTGSWGMMGPGMMGGFGVGWFIPVFGILLLALIIWSVVALFRGTGQSESPGSSLVLLKERYARGEIGREEYEQKKKDLVE